MKYAVNQAATSMLVAVAATFLAVLGMIAAASLGNGVITVLESVLCGFCIAQTISLVSAHSGAVVEISGTGAVASAVERRLIRTHVSTALHRQHEANPLGWPSGHADVAQW